MHGDLLQGTHLRTPYDDSVALQVKILCCRGVELKSSWEPDDDTPIERRDSLDNRRELVGLILLLATAFARLILKQRPVFPIGWESPKMAELTLFRRV